MVMIIRIKYMQNEGLLVVEAGGTYTYQWTLKANHFVSHFL
jgi:hypothetical protein